MKEAGEKYMDAHSEYLPEEGDVIDTRDIEQYLVWIPRFKYQIFNDALDNTKQPLQLINVFFESKQYNI